MAALLRFVLHRQVASKLDPMKCALYHDEDSR